MMGMQGHMVTAVLTSLRSAKKQAVALIMFESAPVNTVTLFTWHRYAKIQVIQWSESALLDKYAYTDEGF